MAIRFMPASRIKKAKSAESQEILARLQQFLEQDAEDGELVKVLCTTWKDQATVISYGEIRQIICDGTVNKEMLQLWSQDYSRLVVNTFSRKWMGAVAAGAAANPILGNERYEFNSQSPGILNWLNKHGGEFVTSCVEEQRKAISALVTKKMVDGHTVDELANLIRPCIGLNEPQAKANARFYDNIVTSMKKEHPRMKEENIQKYAQEKALKYAEQQHRGRAMTIAMTESAFAYNWGADEGIRQAQEQGLLGQVKKKWSTSGDDGVCTICASLEGTEIDMDAEFDIPGKELFTGQHRLPPAHPRCACAMEYIEVLPPVLPQTQNSILSDVIQPDYFSEGNLEENIEHDKPQYLGPLDNNSEDMLESTIEKYESEIAKSDIENAIVITKGGLIFQCFGNKNGVYPDIDLGDELVGASVTHNHPAGSVNEYSFSESDINLFMEYGLKILRGIDEKYIYELVRDPDVTDGFASLEELLASDGELARHQEVVQRAQELGIGYRRKKR